MAVSPTPQQNLAIELNGICHRTFLTHAIFERREAILGRRIKLVGYMGVVVPGIVGLVAMAVGSDSKLPSYLFVVASVLLGIQFVVALLGTFMRWDELFGQAARSEEANMALYREADWSFRQFATLPNPVDEVRRLRDRESELMRTDYRQQITEQEKRFGERSAHYQRQTKCSICGQIPKSLAASGDCDTCGNFKLGKW